MVEQARGELVYLFSESNKDTRCVCYPPPPSPATPTTSTRQTKPAPSAKTYVAVPLSVFLQHGSTIIPAAVDAVGESIKRLFFGGQTTYLHNASFWTTFFNMLSIEMSAGLVVRHGRTRSEAEVRHELVSPLLRRIAHCVSSMAAPEGWDEGIVYSSLLNVETSTEDRPHTPGPKPRVDYTLCGHSLVSCYTASRSK